MTSPQAEIIKKEMAKWVQSMQTDPAPGLGELRDLFAAFAGLGTTPEGVAWTPVDAGGVPAIWADADAGTRDRVVMYFHGGGYVLGSAQFYQNLTGHLARAIGCRVLNVDYRLAPEHPHPAPAEDAVQAFQWLRNQGYSAEHIAVAGDSAGGGLAIATMLCLRDQGLDQPAAAVPISPWADLEATGASMITNAERDIVVSAEMLSGMAAMFLAGGDPKDPHASPIYADFTGLAPIYIQTGGDEAILDDTTRIVAKARAAGVDISSDIFPDMQHVFQIAAGRLPEADDAIAKIASYLRRRLGLSSCPH